MDCSVDLGPIRAIPILDVARHLGLQVKGTKAMCFTGHDAKSPSLSFLRTRNTWRCFGACGKHGDAITLVREVKNVDFWAALSWFSATFGISVASLPARTAKLSKRGFGRVATFRAAPPKPPGQVNIPDPEVYRWFLDRCGAVKSDCGRRYLESHAISTETTERFGLRELRDPMRALHQLRKTWDPERLRRCGLTIAPPGGRSERFAWRSPALLIPFTEDGEIIYIQARMFTGDPKFLNLFGVTKPLFNLERTCNLPQGRRLHLCEGVPDALALESHGHAAVGILGASSFQASWVNHFLRLPVTIVGDGDAAGAKFTTAIKEQFLRRGKGVKTVVLPQGYDAADVLARYPRPHEFS